MLQKCLKMCKRGHWMIGHICTQKAWNAFLFCYYFVVPVLESRVICFKFFTSCLIKQQTLWDRFCPTLCCCVSHKDKAKREPDFSHGLQLARANHCTTPPVTDGFMSVAHIHCKLSIEWNWQPFTVLQLSVIERKGLIPCNNTNQWFHSITL